jgi:TPR repeat protein
MTKLVSLSLLFTFFFAPNSFGEPKRILKAATRCFSTAKFSPEKMEQIPKKLFLKARRTIILQAENGDTGSQFFLGKHYMALDSKINNNRQKTHYWLEKAINSGHQGAEFALGLYLLKQGEKKHKKSKKYLASAAEAGEPFAQYLLSIFFEHGLACKKDAAEATKWREKAESQGIDWGAYIRHEQSFMEKMAWESFIHQENQILQMDTVFLKKE